MPQLDFDGANSKVSADKIQGQSGTTVTIPTGHKINSTDATGIEMAGTAVKAGDWTLATQVAPSTSGNVLTSTGSAWASSAAAGGGAWTVKGTATVFTNISNFTVTGITKTTQIWLTNVTGSAFGTPRITTSSNNGSSYDTGASDYSYTYQYQHSDLTGSNPLLQYADSNANIPLAFGFDTAASTYNAVVTLHSPQNTLTNTTISHQDFKALSTGLGSGRGEGIGTRKSTGKVDAIKFTPSSAATFSGIYTILELN